MKAEWVYNTEEDILTLQIKGRRSQFSLESENDIFTVDLDDSGRVTGIEVFDASEVIAADRTQEQTQRALANIKAADLKYQIKGDYLVVGFKLMSIYNEPLSSTATIPIDIKA